MKKLALVVFSVCFCWGVFAAEAFTAESPKKSRSRHICQDNPVDASGWELHRAPYGVGSKYTPSPLKYQTSCADINPEVGGVVEHDQVGTTWYDFQRNDVIGRMISVTDDGYRHFSWMYTGGPYPGVPRYVNANCKDPVGSLLGPVPADGGEVNAGYCNQTHLHDGTSVIIHHHTAGSPKWHSVLTMADAVCTDTFSRHWDIPDFIVGQIWDDPGMWPRAEAVHDSAQQKDYIHILHRESAAVG